jgi:hypothetical protein
MTRQRFVELAVLALFVCIGFWATDAGADVGPPYTSCNLNASGINCGSTYNCATPGCTRLGVTCEVSVLKRGVCNDPGLLCFTSSSCDGNCGGTSPSCTCPAPAGCT